MLSFEITESGGVEIRGTEKELMALTWWIGKAIGEGEAKASFVPDQQLTSIKVVREED